MSEGCPVSFIRFVSDPPLQYAYDAGVDMCCRSDMLGSKHPLRTEKSAVLPQVLPDVQILQMAMVSAGLCWIGHLRIL